MSTSQIKTPATAAPKAVASSSPAPSSLPPTPPTPSVAPAAGAAASSSVGYRLPDNVTLQNAVKWAIIEDKPVMMDYWADSLEKKVSIGIKENGEKLLVKSVEEYTSPIVKIFKQNTDYIIMTENYIYLVDTGVPVKKIY